VEVLTDADSNPEDFAAHTAKHQFTRIIDAIDLWVPQFKAPDNIVGPGAYGTDSADTDDGGNQAEKVKDLREGEDTETELGLHHQGDCSYPSDLNEVRD
jgi:hypothetical protein